MRNRAEFFYPRVLTIECLHSPTTNTVGRFVSQFLSSFPDLQHIVEEMIAEDDRIAVRFTARGTHKGQWMHFTPTRISIHYTGVTLARIVGNKIVEHQTWWDKASLMEQITGGKR